VESYGLRGKGKEEKSWVRLDEKGIRQREPYHNPFSKREKSQVTDLPAGKGREVAESSRNRDGPAHREGIRKTPGKSWYGR